MIPGFKRSLLRTTLLGVAALGTLIWAAASQLRIDVNTLIAQLIVVALAFALIIALAGALLLIRRLIFGSSGGRAARQFLDSANRTDPDRSKGEGDEAA